MVDPVADTCCKAVWYGTSEFPLSFGQLLLEERRGWEMG